MEVVRPDHGSLLFVHGTLRRQARHRMRGVLTEHAAFLGGGSVAGRLYDFGAYPGAIPSCDGARVRGELYALRHPDSTLEILDRYEGCGPEDEPPYPFQRTTADVHLDSGETTAAWVYWYAGGLTAGRPVCSGDYLDVDASHRQ